MCRADSSGKVMAAAIAVAARPKASPRGSHGDELGDQQRGAAGGDQDGGGDGLVPELAGDRERAGEQRDGLGQPGDSERGAGWAGAGGEAGGRGGGAGPAGDPEAATRREQARQRLAALTPREREVAAAVADGSSNAEIATRLHMSLATVKAHVSRLLVKLDVANRVQIALLVQDAAASRPR
jgi:DNA-binding CsgD family transcriptional regulator